MSGSTSIARSGFSAAALCSPPSRRRRLPSGGYYGPFGPPQEDYGPGVTVSGAGLARVKAPSQLNEDSIRQAVDAARPQSDRARPGRRPPACRGSGRRGGHLARFGATPSSSTPASAERQPCRRSRRTHELHCVVPSFTSASATVTFEIAGGAASSEGARELSASATGSVTR